MFSRLRHSMLVSAMACALLAHPAKGADPAKGDQLFFSYCSRCHSLEPGRHLTGPSLAGFVGRKAGTAEGFRYYSDALKSANLVWDEQALDAWLADPTALVPRNLMRFQGISDPQKRLDLIAYLMAAASAGSGPAAPAQ
jgi:cytochrome c